MNKFMNKSVSKWTFLLLLSVLNGLTVVKPQLIPYGSQQIYELGNELSISDLQQQPTNAKGTSYTFETALKINSVWHSSEAQLLQVYFTAAIVSASTKGAGHKAFTQQITTIPDRPFYISLVGGKPSKVIAHTSRDQSLLNLERGIASLLQIQHSQNGPTPELDVSGHCNAFYIVKSSRRIEKIKTDCSHWDLRVNYRAELPLGVTQHSQERVEYELGADGSLLKAESAESHRVGLEAKPDLGSQVISQMVLQHVAVGEEEIQQLNYGTLEEAVDSLLEWYRVFDIKADVDGALSELKGSTLKDKLSMSAASLSDNHIGKQTLAFALAQLLPLARITKQSELVEILSEHENLRFHLVDLLGSAQTVDAHNAINEVFKYENNDDAELLEKYLQSLAVGTHPERGIIEDLFKRLQDKEQPINNDKLLDSLMQTVAALTKQSSFDVNDPLFKAVQEYILTQFKSACKDADCKTLYIRAMQNLQDQSMIPLLLDVALSEETQVSVAAVQALRSLPITSFNDEHRRAFSNIFYQRQRKYDSSARTDALDLLLALRPTKEQLGHLLEYLDSSDRHFEIKTYVVQKLQMLAMKCPRFASLLKSSLGERPKINNYNILAQKGLTTVLRRQLTRTPAFNESLLSVQEIYQGVLKRGSVEVILGAGREETSTFKLNLFTSGLNSFVGDSDDELEDEEGEEEESPATAGMEITVQGVLLRPLVFFNGKSELMGHVWTGTASEPTPAYQATTLAQDHEHYVILSSGATVYIRVIGMKSIDLNGKVELSIWNRNANTEINQNSGAAVVGLMVAGFTFAKVQNEFALTHEPNLSLQANIDFYSGIKLCMQLQRPNMLMIHSNIKSVHLNVGSKHYSKRISNKQKHIFPGHTLALNQKNNEMCNIIFD